MEMKFVSCASKISLLIEQHLKHFVKVDIAKKQKKTSQMNII